MAWFSVSKTDVESSVRINIKICGMPLIRRTVIPNLDERRILVTDEIEYQKKCLDTCAFGVIVGSYNFVPARVSWLARELDEGIKFSTYRSVKVCPKVRSWRSFYVGRWHNGRLSQWGEIDSLILQLTPPQYIHPVYKLHCTGVHLVPIEIQVFKIHITRLVRHGSVLSVYADSDIRSKVK